MSDEKIKFLADELVDYFKTQNLFYVFENIEYYITEIVKRFADTTAGKNEESVKRKAIFEAAAVYNKVIADLKVENAQLKEVLQNCKETILYVKQYMANKGLSAEDDCNDSLDLINQALKGTKK